MSRSSSPPLGAMPDHRHSIPLQEQSTAEDSAYKILSNASHFVGTFGWLLLGRELLASQNRLQGGHGFSRVPSRLFTSPDSSILAMSAYLCRFAMKDKPHAMGEKLLFTARTRMRNFQPYASLERYIGRRLLAVLAALALTDVAIVLSASLSTALMSTASGADVVRARAIEILNDEGQPVFVATADERQNGALWVGTGNGQGGVSLSTDSTGHGLLVVNTATGAPLISLVSSDQEGGALQVYNAAGEQLAYLGASEVGSGHLALRSALGNLLIAAGEDEGSGLLMANNAAGVNIFLAGADSSQNGGLLINSRTGENLIYAGTGAGGNGGLHVNAANGTHLVFLGADGQRNGAVGIWDRHGAGSVLQK